MSKVIKGGTVVTADRTWVADVLIDGEKIAAIGENLQGDEIVDASEAYVIPGGIDPHTHLEMPFMGTTATETFESGTWAAATGGTTMLVDFCLPGEDGSLIADYIIPYHDVGAHFGRICDAMGLKSPLPRKNVSKMADAPEEDPGLQAEMRDFYAEDYALFDQLDTINAAGLERLAATRP